LLLLLGRRLTESLLEEVRRYRSVALALLTSVLLLLLLVLDGWKDGWTEGREGERAKGGRGWKGEEKSASNRYLVSVETALCFISTYLS